MFMTNALYIMEIGNGNDKNGSQKQSFKFKFYVILIIVSLFELTLIECILDNGVNIVVYNSRDTTNCTYNMQLLEDNLRNLPLGDEFKRFFLILDVPLSLPPTQNLKGCMTYGTQFGIVM